MASSLSLFSLSLLATTPAPPFPPIPRLLYSSPVSYHVNLAACIVRPVPSRSPTLGPCPPHASPLTWLLECASPIPCCARHVLCTSSLVDRYHRGAPLSAWTSSVPTARLTLMLAHHCNTCHVLLFMPVQLHLLGPPRLPPVERDVGYHHQYPENPPGQPLGNEALPTSALTNASPLPHPSSAAITTPASPGHWPHPR
jgi:hypothetical protein